METFRLIWNWGVLLLFASAAVYCAYDVWRMRNYRTTGMKRTILRLRRQNRLLWLWFFLLLVVFRIDRLMELC